MEHTEIVAHIMRSTPMDKLENFMQASPPRAAALEELVPTLNLSPEMSKRVASLLAAKIRFELGAKTLQPLKYPETAPSAIRTSDFESYTCRRGDFSYTRVDVFLDNTVSPREITQRSYKANIPMIVGMEGIPDNVYLDTRENRSALIALHMDDASGVKIDKDAHLPYGNPFLIKKKPNRRDSQPSAFYSDQQFANYLNQKYPSAEEEKCSWESIRLLTSDTEVAQFLNARQCSSKNFFGGIGYVFPDIHSALMFKRWHDWRYPYWCHGSVAITNGSIHFYLPGSLSNENPLPLRLRIDWAKESPLYMPMYLKYHGNEDGIARAHCKWLDPYIDSVSRRDDTESTVVYKFDSAELIKDCRDSHFLRRSLHICDDSPDVRRRFEQRDLEFVAHAHHRIIVCDLEVFDKLFPSSENGCVIKVDSDIVLKGDNGYIIQQHDKQYLVTLYTLAPTLSPSSVF